MSKFCLFLVGMSLIGFLVACNNAPSDQMPPTLEAEEVPTFPSSVEETIFTSVVDGTTFDSPLSTVEPAYTAVIPLESTKESSPSGGILIVTPTSPDEDVIIAEVYNSDEFEYVIIANNSSIPQDLSRWYLYSPRKNQEFQFPENFVLPVDGVVKIYSGTSGHDNPPNEFYWTKDFVWTDETDDVVLLNMVGRVIFWFAY